MDIAHVIFTLMITLISLCVSFLVKKGWFKLKSAVKIASAMKSKPSAVKKAETAVTKPSNNPSNPVSTESKDQGENENASSTISVKVPKVPPPPILNDHTNPNYPQMKIYIPNKILYEPEQYTNPTGSTFRPRSRKVTDFDEKVLHNNLKRRGKHRRRKSDGSLPHITFSYQNIYKIPTEKLEKKDNNPSSSSKPSQASGDSGKTGEGGVPYMKAQYEYHVEHKHIGVINKANSHNNNLIKDMSEMLLYAARPNNPNNPYNPLNALLNNANSQNNRSRANSSSSSSSLSSMLHSNEPAPPADAKDHPHQGT